MVGGIALTVALAGLAAVAPSSSAGTLVDISGSGSTEAYPAIRDWIEGIKAQEVQVNYSPTGSSEGLSDFSNGVADFAASEIPAGVLNEPQPARGYTYVPDAAGAVTFEYNLTVGGQRVTGLRLSGAVIAGIFTGTITQWNDPLIAADTPG